MKILWVSWKDWNHPHAGGAEVVLRELVKRQLADKHQVTVLTAQYPGSKSTEVLDGAKIIRLKGNRYIQPFITLPYYIRNLRGRYDIVVEVVNTAPYFTPFFRSTAKSVLLYHQLARQVWFHEAPFPVGLIGWGLLEPIATFILGKSGAEVIAVSDSTKKNLIKFGFKANKISVISEGIEIEPIKDLSKVTKYKNPTLLSLGSIRPMKRTLDQVKAFEIAKHKIPALKLLIAGDNSGNYAKKVLKYIAASSYKADIEILGRVSIPKKIELMQKSHIVLQTAIKEGWGLTITEAASQGTPAVAYDVDGLRDSVEHGKTGIIVSQSPSEMASAIQKLLKSQTGYNEIRSQAYQFSKTITFAQSYKDFKKTVRL